MGTQEKPLEPLSMADAVEVLINFGDNYAAGLDGGSTPELDQDLMTACQLMLELLTGKVARPDDVEAVFPYEISFSDA